MRLSIAPPAERQAWEKTAHQICLSPSGLYRQRGVWQVVVCVAAPEREREREREDGGDWQRHLDSTWLAELLAANLDNACLFWQRHCGIPEVAVGSALQRTHVWSASDGSCRADWAGKVDIQLKKTNNKIWFGSKLRKPFHRQGAFIWNIYISSSRRQRGANPFIWSLLNC